MNYNQTNIEYNTSYPYVLQGENNPNHVSSTGFTNTNEIYPAVCTTHLDDQYKLPNVANIPELDCPNASGGTKVYSELNQSTPNNMTTTDLQWWYTNNNNLQFNSENKCIPQFNNSIQICTPRDCGLGNPNHEFLHGFQCNKMWNNHTKRRFINNRK